jgi:hypothetical protein
MVHRREFLQRAGAFALLAPRRAVQELRTTVAIIGGGLGGVAAALAALRQGARVVLTDETDWIGGQVTSQAVPPDEHAWIESHGCTRAYREYRFAVREYYRRYYPLTESARAAVQLNPGNGSVSRIAHEPRVSLAVLETMLAPYVATGQLTMLLTTQPIAADVEGDRVRAITVRSLTTGRETTIRADYFLDATDTGELLPLTRTEYVTGFESRRETGEFHAPDRAAPLNMQAFTVCFAMDYLAGEDHTIDRPGEYTFWRNFAPTLTPAWPGRLLALEHSNPQTLEPLTLGFDPASPDDATGRLNLMVYRRILHRRNFAPGHFSSDVTIVNWPQNDYFLGPLYDLPAPEAARHLERAKGLSLSLLYWLQTEAPRPDGGQGWRGLRLRRDIVGTEDGLAKQPYVRESRRIRAEFTVREDHVGADARARLTGRRGDELTAEAFPDSVGIGSYRIDLHMSTGGDNYIDVASLPFQIPLGTLLPVRMENLLPACKNIGTTHITNGCYRLHPVEWNVGEASGALAAYATATKQTPRAIRQNPRRLADFQQLLRAEGFELEWPQASNPRPQALF